MSGRARRSPRQAIAPGAPVKVLVPVAGSKEFESRGVLLPSWVIETLTRSIAAPPLDALADQPAVICRGDELLCGWVRLMLALVVGGVAGANR